MGSQSKDRMELLRIERDVKECKNCDLWKTRTKPVVGDGLLDAPVMFIGEAPGYHEDLQGKPFVGKAGKLFDELLLSIGLQRKNVYVANVLKCRPPDNRDPLDSEIKACTPFLDRQLVLIQPRVIVTLGNFAWSYISKKFGLPMERIGKIHGYVFRIKALLFDSQVVPMYHPAAAVYNLELKKELLDDFKTIIKTMA